MESGFGLGVATLLFLPLVAMAECGLSQNVAGEYLVGTFADLQKVGVGDCSGDSAYRLSADIEADSTVSFPSIGSFGGKLHGAGHVIANLRIKEGTLNIVGLFANMSGSAVVDSLGLDSIVVSGGRYTGALVGMGGGTVRDVFVRGRVNGAYPTGGLAGSFSGSVTDSYVDASVNGENYIGGLAGEFSGTMERCFSVNSMDFGYTTAKIGGLVGKSTGSIIASYAFYYTTKLTMSLAGESGTGAVMDKLSAALEMSELTDSAKYKATDSTLWDFDSTWVIFEGRSTPLLRAFMTRLMVKPKLTLIYYSCENFAGGTYTVTPSKWNNDRVYGSIRYGGPAAEAVDAGTYVTEILTDGLYSDQRGYWFTGDTALFVIIPRPLSVTGITAEDKNYDGTTAATITGTAALSGVVCSEDVSLSGVPVAKFEDAAPGADKSVSVSGFTLSGDSTVLANYSLYPPLLNASIIEVDALPFEKRHRLTERKGRSFDALGKRAADDPSRMHLHIFKDEK